MYQLDLFAETTKTTKNTKAARIINGEEHHSAETMREIEKLESKLHQAQIRLFDYSQAGLFRKVGSTKAHISFLERRIKALYTC
jgi:hypothetical protein